MNYIIKKDKIPYQVAHLTSAVYKLDGKFYGPESYLIMGPGDKYYKAMTPEEFQKFFDIERFKIEKMEP